MGTPADSIQAEKLRTAFDLPEARVEMKRASIRRRYPGIGSREVERLVEDWLLERKLPMEGVEGYRVRRYAR